MAAPKTIDGARYVAFTTYRRDGSSKTTPVWIVDLGDGSYGFTTSSSSHKVKRLANDPRCSLQPCDKTGNITEGSEIRSGQAVASRELFERVKPIVADKYGFQYRVVDLIGKGARLIGKGSGTDTGVVITLDDDTDEN